mmetsp:Transcript_25088/g.50959  ORF Transcript_25088/g.50959 Transcript_25088/m.50959 type:complete len:181 (+) Transcript_25088:839-1381(+)
MAALQKLWAHKPASTLGSLTSGFSLVTPSSASSTTTSSASASASDSAPPALRSIDLSSLPMLSSAALHSSLPISLPLPVSLSSLPLPPSLPQLFQPRLLPHLSAPASLDSAAVNRGPALQLPHSLGSHPSPQLFLLSPNSLGAGLGGLSFPVPQEGGLQLGPMQGALGVLLGLQNVQTSQ